jgi:hypothetical protein
MKKRVISNKSVEIMHTNSSINKNSIFRDSNQQIMEKIEPSVNLASVKSK